MSSSSTKPSGWWWPFLAGVFVGGLVGGLSALAAARSGHSGMDSSQAGLMPVDVGGATFLFPKRARVVSTSATESVVSWAPSSEGAAEKTRCGVRAEAHLRASRQELPDGFSVCGSHDAFEGGSSQGDCPVTTVCLARRGALDLHCESDDDTCRAVVQAFTGRAPSEVW